MSSFAILILVGGVALASYATRRSHHDETVNTGNAVQTETDKITNNRANVNELPWIVGPRIIKDSLMIGDPSKSSRLYAPYRFKECNNVY